MKKDYSWKWLIPFYGFYLLLKGGGTSSEVGFLLGFLSCLTTAIPISLTISF